MPLYLFYTMVQKSQKWPKTQIKGGGPALNDATVLSAWMSGGKSFHRMMDLGRKAFNARDDLTVGTGKLWPRKW